MNAVPAQPGRWRGSVVTIGAFDGVHTGHQAIVHLALQRANERGMPVVVITFDRHPQEILLPEKPPLYLTTLGSRLRLLLAAGVRDVLVLRFDSHFARLEAEAFLYRVLHERLAARHIVVGGDFRFGHGRQGDVGYLQSMQTRFGFQVEAAPDVLYRGERVSSSRIRQVLLEGRVQEAADMLGRAYVLEGTVVKGQQLGRRLGYPTVNLQPLIRQVVPADGVYAGKLLQVRKGATYPAAISIGVRPTVDGKQRTIEAYLLGFEGNLYGEEVHLAFFYRLRDEQKFDSLEALRAQMARDVQQVAELVGRGQ